MDLHGLTTATGLLADEIHTLTGWRTVDHVPGKLSPPTCVVVAANPWLTPGQDTYGTWLGHWEAHFLAAPATNAAELSSLVDALTDTITGLSDTWGIGEIEPPWVATVNDALYLTLTIPVDALVTV